MNLPDGGVRGRHDRAGGGGRRHDLIVAPLTPFPLLPRGAGSEDLARFSALASARRTYVAVAMGAGRDGRRFHTSVLLDRDGRVAGPVPEDARLPGRTMALGDDLPVFQTDFGVVGFSLGTDFYFPKSTPWSG